ncbi:hypothetical protein [Ensifer sp. LC163]|uniref:hypothetical protein n=1 Tax=Ensifer sp. LC163 TaxID=1120652 RepID=UPI001374826C|nr:hypothetical protein [Ensifer sp. LC163]
MSIFPVSGSIVAEGSAPEIPSVIGEWQQRVEFGLQRGQIAAPPSKRGKGEHLSWVALPFQSQIHQVWQIAPTGQGRRRGHWQRSDS